MTFIHYNPAAVLRAGNKTELNWAVAGVHPDRLYFNDLATCGACCCLCAPLILTPAVVKTAGRGVNTFCSSRGERREEVCGGGGGSKLMRWPQCFL